MSKGCETGPPVYRPYPRRLESLTICRCNYKGSTFLLTYLKTLSGGPAGVWTHDLPHSSPELNQYICFFALANREKLEYRLYTTELILKVMKYKLKAYCFVK